MKELYGKIRDGIAGVFFVAGITLIMIDVIMRYVFNNALYWGDEVAMYLIIWAGLIGWSTAADDKRHIKVDLLWGFLPKRAKWVIEIFANMVGLAFSGFFLHAGWQNVMNLFTSGMRSSNSGILYWPIFMVLPLAGLLLALHFVFGLIELLRHGTEAVSEGGEYHN